ncbi:MAG TPA: glycerate kinase [Eubacteriales bacterium]|nr:glycerate kinase [Eubacteriales bacterium]
MTLREDAGQILQEALAAALPDTAVKKALEGVRFGDGKLVLVAAGKAAWQMASAAYSADGLKIGGGVVITKYGYAKGPIGELSIREAGHPVPDENTFSATEEVIHMVSGLAPEDTVLFLLSGGGSALFEKPLIPKEELYALTDRLLACGADITEMNTVRKRLSAVKGGRFAQICAPAHVFSIVLSDIIGDPLDMIASGPAYPDASSSGQALSIIKKYDISVSDETIACLRRETPKRLDNVTTVVTGSVRQLCSSAEAACRRLGYEPVVLTASLSCTARDAGSFLGSIAQFHADDARSIAFIAGGETVVRLTGKGKGGRNQEIALAAAEKIAGLADCAVFSFGSDGTDGPTDAAGGFCDGDTAGTLRQKGIDIDEVLIRNDSYHALKACGGLIVTGPTGTNVNDLSIVLIRRKTSGQLEKQ